MPEGNRTSSNRRHDGFYFRAGLGYGNVGIDASLANAPYAVNYGGSGGGVAAELAFGGTPARGLVVGAGIYGINAGSPSYDSISDGRGAEYSAGAVPGAILLSMLGPFIDFYPKPDLGFHLEASLGLARVVVGDGHGKLDAVDTTGLGLMAGAGYEWWIGDQWSIGPLLRVQYAAPSAKDNDGDSFDLSFLSWGLIAAATYH